MASATWPFNILLLQDPTVTADDLFEEKPDLAKQRSYPLERTK
jgi:hypothetical protein